jgi:raffinose/stachyose/melibiose transport system substrate-binding protein
MKKIMSLILTALMISSLSGCSSNSTQPAANKPAENQPAQAQPKERVKLSLWHIQTNKTTGPVVDAAVERFKKDNPNVDVEVLALENDPYKTKLKVAMGSGNPPDVFHSWGGGWLEAFVKDGMVMDITQELNKDKWRDIYFPAALSMTQFNGKDYGVPCDLSSAPIWYNKELFKKYNLEIPKTYSEFLKVIKTFKDNGIIPLSLANQTKWPGALFFVYLSNRLGGEQTFLNAYGRKGATFEDPTFVQAGKMIQDLVNMGAFSDGFNGMNYDTGASRMLMYSDKAAMQLQTSGFYSVVRSEQPEYANNKLDFFLFPAVENGKGDPTNVVGGVNSYSVSSKTKNKELALKLAKYLTDQTAAQDWIDKSGRVAPVFGTKISDPIGMKLSDALSKAHYLQGYYDQLLPPELGELHKDTVQGIFGKTMTPEEAAKKMEEKAKEILK